MDVLLVDGYNIIGDWDVLNRLRKNDLEKARDQLIEQLAEYKVYTGLRIIVCFDAYEVKGLGSKTTKYGIEIIYTKEKETADDCIERMVKTLKNAVTKVYVATSDSAEQNAIFFQGAYRKSARELMLEVKEIQAEIKQDLNHYQKNPLRRREIVDESLLETLESMRRGEKL